MKKKQQQYGRGEVSSSSSVVDLFLTSDERFQVWEVKAAERPHLLCWAHSVSDDDDDDDDDDEDKECKNDSNNNSDDDDDDEGTRSSSTITLQLLPLTDGCDIPGWRMARIAYYYHNANMLDGSDNKSNGKEDDDDDFLHGALGIGQGCTLLRLESQLPPVGLSTRMTARSDWKALRAKLLLNVVVAPTTTSVPHNDDDKRACKIQMIPRISYKNDPKNAVLHAWFERESVPVLLEGCMSDWAALQTCRWDVLVNGQFGHYPWRFSDTHGETLSLKTYDKYCKSLEGLTDDSPLAIYDSQFHTDARQCLLHDYQVPSCFATDLFALLDNNDEDGEDDDDDEKDHTISSDENEDSCSSSGGGDDENDANTVAVVERPPYRWILMGPERSGTGLHVDPVGTHAWVSLIQGCKRWVLFPPDTCRKTIGMQQEQEEQGQYPIPSVLWFRDYYENVCSPQGTTFVQGAVHVVQRPGETVYVPAGWPHLVLNLEASVAITENYATEFPSMDRLWRAVVEAEPALAVRFRKALEKHRPDLAAQINNHDDDPNATDDAAFIENNKNNNNNKSYVSCTMQTTNHGVTNTCAEQVGSTSQSEKDRSLGCRIVNYR
jgi:histone arginine demethylase JMJD6